jgi:integral membrane protein (TIGR01906 family)
MTERATTDHLVAGLMGGIQAGVSMLLAVSLLISPSCFQKYYPLLRISNHTADAQAVVDWLSTSYRQRTLSLALAEGQFSSQELQHYADVRRLFRWFPKLTVAGAVVFLVLLAAIRPSRKIVIDSQRRSMFVSLLILLTVGTLALWDWKLLFALVHRPFFGDVSWRLPNSAYSLQLFPARFWQWTLGVILIAPVAGAGSVILVVLRFRSKPHAMSLPQIPELPPR